AVFAPGVYGASQEGQVAVVEQVFNDGTYSAGTIDELACSKDATACARVVRMTYGAIQDINFIHYKKDTRTTWGFAGGQSGWTPSGIGEGKMFSSGWYYSLTGTNPRITSPALEIPLDGYNTVEVEMVTDPAVKDANLQIYFQTDSRQGFTETRSARIDGSADGQLHKYALYFGQNLDWHGTLVGLSIRPAGGMQGGVRIDRVRLTHVEPEAQQFITQTTSTPNRPSGARSR
ncbi:MAG: hypothetical protein M3014_08960, partial [Chloroflexota bacterium]|nr:hypothetical protein [Chloroflexota bacterium]